MSLPVQLGHCLYNCFINCNKNYPYLLHSQYGLLVTHFGYMTYCLGQTIVLNLYNTLWVALHV